ncbi:phenol hydroxylase [Acinetobacter lactucae]|uniref:NADH:ubiquinone reductase (Na(+)-transporting) subunit F n=1 Tax=Acinetobacter calcoaceticus/baumannii complex TaxID=909768 RepID=UPI0007A0AD17|nr:MULTISPECIES: phenol 2-monooxygenase domain-containing protein [Acinetobacter calcoaceticus/baumannii complex]KYQ80887.1 phenol hydroxylase [Acinetobacter lactucae]QXA09644.1 2Fe-2S iron-sulfur cluster binding domain-containing protein [Acinetobacter pittii]
MSYQVTIEPIGTTIEVEDDQTILDAALRQGVWLPFACGHGTCGTCKVQVTDGFYDVGEASPFALMDIERDENKVLACCCKPQSDMVIEADVDEDPDFLGHLVQDYQATVIEIKDLSPTIKGVRLQLDRPIEFQAGQYINVQFPNIEGTRAFSIANSPSEVGIVELHIRKVEGGAATTYVHEQLATGDQLDISGPYGQFFVRKSDDQNAIFIAGGSGLSSPQSMILDLLESGDSRTIYLFQGARDLAELYNRELFEQLVKDYSNFRYIPALNTPKAEDQWTGFTGFVHEAVADYFENRCGGHKAYLCGPPIMIDSAISTLMQSRLFERDIHTERFLSAADGAAGQSRSALFKHI